MLILCKSYAYVWLASNKNAPKNEANLKSAHEDIIDVMAREFGNSGAQETVVLEILNRCTMTAYKKLGNKLEITYFQNLIFSLAEQELYLYYASLHPEAAEDEIPQPDMQVEDEQELEAEQDVGSKRKIAGSYLEVASLANSASRKKQKVLVDPSFSWYQTVQEDSSKNLKNFSSSVDFVRRGILGLTIDDSVMIPKNFDACFGRTATILRILMDHLKIKTIEGPLTLDFAKYSWCKVFGDPNQQVLDELKLADPDNKIGSGILNLMEAVEFITQPRILIDSRPGIDYVRYLICEAHQARYENKLQQVEASFKYSSKTQKVFEDTIIALTPNLGDLPKYICSMLKRIVQNIFSQESGKKACEAICSIAESFYIEDRSIVARSYNTTVRKRLTADGKKVVQRKGKLAERHYETYKSIVKPTIETAKQPLTIEELTVVKKINQQLQTLETQCVLPDTTNQKLRKNSAKDLITLYHEKCRRVERVFVSRRQQIHNMLKQQRNAALDASNASDSDRQKDKNIPFTTEEWRVVTTSFLKSDDSLIEVLTHEFKLQNGLVAFDAINKKYFSQLTEVKE
jgi:hypothetical protein